DLDCVRHHAVQLSGILWRRATLVRYWADFFISLGGLSVPVDVLSRFGATVSARKNPVPGGLAFALAKERRKTDDSVF
ncbi:MAG: hypothetical protein WBM31_21865, partial [Pseudolabrys sp.]